MLVLVMLYRRSNEPVWIINYICQVSVLRSFEVTCIVQGDFLASVIVRLCVVGVTWYINIYIIIMFRIGQSPGRMSLVLIVLAFGIFFVQSFFSHFQWKYSSCMCTYIWVIFFIPILWRDRAGDYLSCTCKWNVPIECLFIQKLTNYMRLVSNLINEPCFQQGIVGVKHVN